MFKYCLVMFCCGIIVSFINFNFRILNSVDILFLKIPHMRRINPTILNSRIDASNLKFFKIFKIVKPVQYAVLIPHLM